MNTKMTKTITYKSKIEKAWNWALVYLMIFFSSSFSLSVYNGTTRILLYGLLLVLIALNIFLYKKNLRVKSSIVFLLPLIASLSYLLNGESIKQFEILLFYYLISFVFVIYLDFDKWCDAYLGVIQFIAILSIILYFIYIAFPSIIDALPTTANSAGRTTHTIFFCLTPFEGRSIGIFWEPGAFQIYLMIAIIIEYFTYGLKRYSRLAILLIANILTFSTTAFIATGVLIIVILTNEIIEGQLRKGLGISIVVSLLIIIVVSYFTEKAGIDIYTKVFSKIDRYRSSPTSYGSAAVRFNSIIKAFDIFIQNPILGVGTTKLNNSFLSVFGNSMTTCTFINWFAISGLFYGTLMSIGVFKFSKLFTKRRIVSVLLLLLIFVLISSEDMVLNPSFIILILYGYLGYHSFEKGQQDPEKELVR